MLQLTIKLYFMKAPLLILCIIFGLSTSCINETYGPERAPTTFAATWPCENGMADVYPCNGYDLMSYLSLQDLTPEGVNNGSIAGNAQGHQIQPLTKIGLGDLLLLKPLLLAQLGAQCNQ